MRRRGPGLAPTPCPKRNAARDHRQAEREIAEERIGLARELGGEAQHPVADEEKRRYPAARPRPGGEPPQDRKEREAFERELVELRWVTRRVARVAEHHAPGQVGDAAP